MAAQGEFFRIGMITRPHGLKGEVKVIPDTDFLDRFLSMETVVLETPDGRRQEHHIKNARLQQGFIIMQLEGYEDATAAERLRNCVLKVTREGLVPLPEGQYYLFELIGLTVITDDGRHLGKITEVLQPGANDVYVVKPEDPTVKQDYLLPAIKDVVKSIDLESGQVVVHLLPGLIDED